MQLIEWKLELRGTSSVSETDHFPGMRAGSTVPLGERTALMVRQELRGTSKLGFVHREETRPSFRLMGPPAKSREPASSRRHITAPHGRALQKCRACDRGVESLIECYRSAEFTVFETPSASSMLNRQMPAVRPLVPRLKLYSLNHRASRFLKRRHIELRAALGFRFSRWRP